MNYSHTFHAGNFADVFKHVVLVALLESLTRKDKPLFFLDTHAGRGRYDLAGAEAQRSGEADAGIHRLAAAGAVAPAVDRYLELVRSCNRANTRRIRYYPGSPLLASMLLRPGDRLAVCDIERREATALRREFAGDRRVAVHLRDGHEALRALLPPAERRGIALIDPPYEAQEQDLSLVADSLAAAQRRWPEGVYAAWYPIKRGAASAVFHASLAARGVARLLVAELSVHPLDNAVGLNGSGLVILNPPWRLDELLVSTLPALHATLAPQGAGQTRVSWVVPE